MTETFTSAYHVFGGRVSMISDEDDSEFASSWIRHAKPGEEMKNWKTVEIPQIFHYDN